MKTTLRPGLLVALKTSVTGNVSYEKNDIVRGAKLQHWETKRRIADPAEHEQAIKTRAKVRTLIRSVCASTGFGFFCLEDKEGQLIAARAEAEKLVDAFNAKAKNTTIWFGLMVGKVGATDLQAVRDINNEVRELLTQMNAGVSGNDIDTIRDAADRAKQVAGILASEAQQLVDEAVEAARKAASSISRAQRKGEEIDAVAMKAALAAINEKKKSFLDFDVAEAKPVTAAKAKRTLDIEENARGL